MPNWEDYLQDMVGGGKKKPASMWPEPSMPQDQRSGIAGTLGTLAQLGGTVANFIPGGQVVGIPLMIGGGALKGADKGGITGALKGGGMAAGTSALGAVGDKAIGGIMEGLKLPVDAGTTNAFSSGGSPLTVPGVRPEDVSVFSSQGSPMTVPASPKTVGGS